MKKVSRQILEGGTYNDPYHVDPIELTKKRQRKIFLVQHLLGWQDICSDKGGRRSCFKILIVEDDKELSQLFQKSA
mgnify:CR=1 FL=1